MKDTLFLRLTNESDKANALQAVLLTEGHHLRFEVEANSFELVPGSPFAYWVNHKARTLFTKFDRLASNGRDAQSGASSMDDPRFLRGWWEVESDSIGNSRQSTLNGTRWIPLQKGGDFSKYYQLPHLVISWSKDGLTIKEKVSSYRGMKGWGFQWTAALNGHSEYFRPGLTWPRRSQKGLGFRAMPNGCIFGDKGPSILVDDNNSDHLLALLGILNSSSFQSLVKMQMAFGSWEVGVIERTPLPPLSTTTKAFLGEKAESIWGLKQKRDQVEEISHVFLLPALLMTKGNTLADCSVAWNEMRQTDESAILCLQAELDEKCWELYGIPESDRPALLDPGIVAGESEGGSEPEVGDGEGEGESETDAIATVTNAVLAEDLSSWLFGAAVGRWDVTLATGERPIPPLPGPFDKLLPVSRGMLLGADGLHPAKDTAGRFMPEHDLLLDDEGESLDLVRRVREVLERVAGERADAWLLELEGLLGADLRTWYRRAFFDRHLKRYSKSRRKAPIYWQLGTPSGSYSVWLYYPRLTRDSLFRLLNDVVKPKVAYEEQRLAGMREQNARRSELEPQEALVEELQAFRDEVARVTPLFDPNLDDGVLINAAPLHRLFVHAGWRRDTQAAWTQLVRGDFEWSHMALHLWPERVIPLCAEQRHLALAHNLEGPLRTRSVEDLVAAHSRPAVKDALQALLNASPQAGGRSAGRPARTPRAPRPATEPRAAAEPTPRAPRASAEVPEVTLAAIREVLARFPGGAAKSDVLSATGIPDGTWNTAIAQLLATGDVERQGEKRGTRYFLKP